MFLLGALRRLSARAYPVGESGRFCLAHGHDGFSIFNGDNVVENRVCIAQNRCLAWPATRCLQKWQWL